MVGIGVLAAVGAGVAYVRYRERETEQLRRGAGLAAELRELARGDVVRLAAVDEYEVALYERLFAVSTVSPRIRSAVWALLAAVLAAVGGLATRGDGLYLTVLHGASVVLAAVFGLAALFFAGFAAFHAATTPRVSFSESYASSPDASSPDSDSDSNSADSASSSGASSKGSAESSAFPRTDDTVE